MGLVLCTFQGFERCDWVEAAVDGSLESRAGWRAADSAWAGRQRWRWWGRRITAFNDEVGLQLSKSRRVLIDIDFRSKICSWWRSSGSHHSVCSILCVWLERWLLPHLRLRVIH